MTKSDLKDVLELVRDKLASSPEVACIFFDSCTDCEDLCRDMIVRYAVTEEE